MYTEMQKNIDKVKSKSQKNLDIFEGVSYDSRHIILVPKMNL